MTDILAQNPFDGMRRFRPDGSEFWSARDLQAALGYVEWRKFSDAMERARLSCENMGHNSADHFGDAAKMVGIGSGTERSVADFHLSRYACYLTAMNGDPRKPEIAAAQAYFVQQTRKAELFEAAAQNGTTPALISARLIGEALGCSNKSAINRMSHHSIKPTHHFFEPLCRAAAYLYPLDVVQGVWPSAVFTPFAGEALAGVLPVAQAIAAQNGGKIAKQTAPRLIPTDTQTEQLARRLLSLEAQKRDVLRQLAVAL